MLKGSILVQMFIKYLNTAEHCLWAQENTMDWLPNCVRQYTQSHALNFSLLQSAFRFKDKSRCTNWTVVESITVETSNTNHFLSNRKNSVDICEIHKLGRSIQALYMVQNNVFLKEFWNKK